jgi:hypothetical protein
MDPRNLSQWEIMRESHDAAEFPEGLERCLDAFIVYPDPNRELVVAAVLECCESGLCVPVEPSSVVGSRLSAWTGHLADNVDSPDPRERRCRLRPFDPVPRVENDTVGGAGDLDWLVRTSILEMEVKVTDLGAAEVSTSRTGA